MILMGLQILRSSRVRVHGGAQRIPPATVGGVL